MVTMECVVRVEGGEVWTTVRTTRPDGRPD
ncbi:hypothetical protein H4687_004166 [Streptomyces stelliscabiei]|uniref:Uncharacterized protein n=1 Tax=Streptomyces stelliscabiei TaxID=146820 RepID=A0A8I0P6H0_9ACTN|nr:hypothetical protein [Streptomyces stelliscabiei]